MMGATFNDKYNSPLDGPSEPGPSVEVPLKPLSPWTQKPLKALACGFLPRC